jgi:hypothetical protein
VPIRSSDSFPEHAPAGAQRSGQPVDHRLVEALSGDAPTIEMFGALATRIVPGTATALSDYLGLAREEVEGRLASLERHGVIEPVTAPGAGGEAAYRTVRDALITDEEWAQFTPGQRRRMYMAVLSILNARIWSALENGGFDAHDTHVSCLPTDLDRRGYEDMVALTLDTLERARDIQAAVVQRRAEGAAEEDAIKAELMILHFRRTGGEDAAPPEPARDLRERVYDAGEDVADAVSLETPDWQALAAAARELAVLAQRLAATAPVPAAD